MSGLRKEIKFRAWDANKKEMLEDATTIAIMVGRSVLESETGNTHVVMQYTGLKDKDGFEIYEGDIVSYQYLRGDPVQDVVKFEYTGFDPFQYCGGGGEYIPEDCEVIGNIHENPELLEGKA